MHLHGCPHYHGIEPGDTITPAVDLLLSEYFELTYVGGNLAEDENGTIGLIGDPRNWAIVKKGTNA